jgi:short-subunit dehydrogenase
MTQLARASVLVTGGARGLGKRIAARCVEEGASRVILWDIDEATLTETAEELRTPETAVESAVVDMTDADRVEDAARSLSVVDVLFNNAGIVVGKSFAEHSRGDIERSIGVNVLGAMHAARLLLPGMIERRRGHVVNIASAVGMTPHPNMSVYAASKWAVLGWSESLRLELESQAQGVHVTTVCPGYIETGMFEGARAPLLTPLLDPDVAVDRIIHAVSTNRILLRAPRTVNLLPVLRGVLPTRVYDLVIGRGFRIYSSMDRFVGRSGSR